MSDTLFVISICLCAILSILVVLKRQFGLENLIFFIGINLLVIELGLEHTNALLSNFLKNDNRFYLLIGLKSITPVFWLGFSLIYFRGNRYEFLKSWKWILAAGLFLPLSILILSKNNLYSYYSNSNKFSLCFNSMGKLWIVFLIVILLLALVNFEKTFRASVGMSRWRIKYLFLGISIILGVKLYGLSQILLSSFYYPSINYFESIAFILSFLLMMIGHLRSGFNKIDLYPSRVFLERSLILMIAGTYFIIVGSLSKIVMIFGLNNNFPAQGLVVLFGLIGFAALILSDRFQAVIRRLISRHFRRAEHDFRLIWTEFTRRTSNVSNSESLGKNAAHVISENFNILGVSIFEVTIDCNKLKILGSSEHAEFFYPIDFLPHWSAEIARLLRPFNLEKESSVWANQLRKVCKTKFKHGGPCWVVPLVAAENLVGIILLTDRVNGMSYSHEEIDLLHCIGDQLASGLLNFNLAEKIFLNREVEAFQTVSTFFVHDLKNAANSLSLTLENLPIHFNDPDFRSDCIKTVGKTVQRINRIISKLSSLRQDVQLNQELCRLDIICIDSINNLNFVNLKSYLSDVPEVYLDRDAMCSVVTNLLMNAREALKEKSDLVKISCDYKLGFINLIVEDEGCGMTSDFIRNRLFRPFDSTKNQGLGIGMFQCKKIIEAHGGEIFVDSQVGQGTTFTITLKV
jgi:putative PEP-CTERM system histidine kinase